ncbi:hypothetical protein ACFQ3P_37800 [Paraburkholderia sabiae]|uniref:Uncharacterized protein n=1 Tax=Paraburkholderia sabiae TaxID=273251 RepID=A0ABU9QMR8_9BURK|nr:hypothetical protein [Paraburkholderia sabiae]WJZ79944.1 hypothetical protein QEN71_43100 [Paraburkholderia sabiae]
MSKQAFQKRLCQQAIPTIAVDGVLDLFNSQATASQQLVQIEQFLNGFTQRHGACLPRNLVIYYVGRAYLYGKNQDYLFALASTGSNNAPSGLMLIDLATALFGCAKEFQRFIILDCCFSRPALRVFQHGECVVARKAAKAFTFDATSRPDSVTIGGTAVLCASTMDDAPLGVGEYGCTIFSDALVRSLDEGDWGCNELLSTRVLFDMIDARIERMHRDQLHIELHATNESDGNPTLVGLFRNRTSQQSSASIFDQGLPVGTYFGPTQRSRLLRKDKVFARLTVQNLVALMTVILSYVLFSVWDHSYNGSWPGALFIPLLIFSCCAIAVINSRNFFQAVVLSSVVLGILTFVNLMQRAPESPVYSVFFLVAISVPFCVIAVFIIAILRARCRKIWRSTG